MSTIQQRRNAAFHTRGTVDVGMVLYFLLDVAEILLALRLILTILGRSAENGFAQLIDTLSQPLVAPFLNMGARDAARFDGSILLAMLVYAIGIYLVVQFLRLFDET